MSKGRAGLGLALALGGGLTLAGASLAAWVREVRSDDVGGVPIESETVTLGVELAPLALPLGVLAAVLGFGLALRHAVVRRMLGGALVVVGIGALVSVVVGILAASDQGGGVASGAVLAAVATVAIGAAGVLAVRPAPPPAPALPARYDLDAEDDEDAEWHLASVEDEEAVEADPDDGNPA